MSGSKLKSTLKVSKCRGFTSLKGADIEDISLLESHIPRSAELLINHVERWGRGVDISSIDFAKGSLTFLLSKTLDNDTPNADSVVLIEITFRNLPVHIMKVWSRKHMPLVYTHMEKGQQSIVFLPFPSKRAFETNVGRIIATTPTHP